MAFYTQGNLKITDQFSLTLGFRYSKDTRDGLEQRGGYSELTAASWLPWAISTVLDGTEGFNADDLFAPGVTPLAAMNVAMGNATFTGDADFPIAPVCDFRRH